MFPSSPCVPPFMAAEGSTVRSPLSVFAALQAERSPDSKLSWRMRLSPAMTRLLTNFQWLEYAASVRQAVRSTGPTESAQPSTSRVTAFALNTYDGSPVPAGGAAGSSVSGCVPAAMIPPIAVPEHPPMNTSRSELSAV
jgi:hypothetical protein